MAVKKAPVKTVKKTNTVKKAPARKIKPTKKAEVKIAAVQNAKPLKASGLLSWFFIPDMAQSRGRWAGRALLWTIGFAMFIFIFGAIGLQSNFVDAGLNPPTFLGAAAMIGFAAVANPGSLVIPMIFSLLIGLFIFMPRKLLDRTSAVALSWTFTFWTMLASGIMMAVGHFEINIDLGVIPLYVATLGGIIGLLAAIVAFARYLKIPKLAVFLSFPFGAILFEYAAYFLPINTQNKTIDLKYNWYRRLVGFLLDTKNGQVVLLALLLVSIALFPSPWEIFMIIFFFPLYFWKGTGWMVRNITPLSWVVAIANIAFIAYIVHFARSIDAAMMLVGY